MSLLRQIFYPALCWQLLVMANALSAQVPAKSTHEPDLQAKRKLYQLSADELESWDSLSDKAERAPDEIVNSLIERLSQLDSKSLLEISYGELTLIHLLLKLERAPEALERIAPALASLQPDAPPIYRARFLEEQARAQNILGQYQKALSAINSALREMKAIDAKREVSQARMVRGMIHLSLELYDKALEDYFFAYQYFKSVRDTSTLPLTMAAIAQVYSQTEQHLDAIRYYKEALEAIGNTNNTLMTSILLFNIGIAHDRAGHSDQAKIYLNKALAISQDLGDEMGMAYVWFKLGNLQLNRGQYEQALENLKRAHPIVLSNQDHRMQINVELAMAKSLTNMGEFRLAHEWIDSALAMAEQLETQYELINAHETRAQAYAKNGQYELAFGSLGNYIDLFKKDISEKNQQALNKLKISFDTATKEAQNELLLKENTLNRLTIEKQAAQSRLLWALFFLCLIVVVLIMFVLWRQIQVRKRFSALALTDELTQAPNRRNIVEFARFQLEQCQSTKTPIAIAIIDLDKFKVINDSFGHDVGDKVLQQFYALGKATLRSSDRLGRFGGEEWLLVMPGFLTEQLNDIFIRLRDAVNAQTISGLPNDKKITFSMGVVSGLLDQPLETLLMQADSALYQAKSQGRDQWQIGNR